MSNNSELDTLVDCLIAARDAKKDPYASICELLNKLGYKESLSPKHIDAFLIKSAEYCFSNNKIYRDMVLMSLGLLHGYKSSSRLESRRALFLIYSNYLIICSNRKNKDYLSADKDEQENMRDALRKKEKECFKNIASFLCIQKDITKFVNEIDDYVVKNNNGKIISVNIPYPTYLVDNCVEYRTRITLLEIIKVKNYIEILCDALGIETKKSKTKNSKAIQTCATVIVICLIGAIAISLVQDRIASSQEPLTKIEITELSPMKDSQGLIDETRRRATNNRRVILTNEDEIVDQSLDTYWDISQDSK